ncbi:penicillin-binding protein 1C [Bdellovibrio reynosensis]|uniref:peptidoglycan glycosyltransferase n=1 Tax=Bdellovibrio reynosensis TaxID=2835041 RepID=A0ABY4C5X0_9BACT|nr:penicillin-binding protein 1C [Bdellovibrio reynosensis]UOF00129.1 penicillin-binding protein 1C [Bdellovibrio reynosensis]
MKLRTKWVLSFIIPSLIFSAGVFVAQAPAVPEYDLIKTRHKGSELWLKDRNGHLLHQMRVDNQERSFTWMSLKQASPALINSVFESEDKNFIHHSGVDYKALVASLYQRVFKRSSRGGSTISMQLLKLLSKNRNYYSGITGKIRQVRDAYNLEQSWSKDEILEAYLNLIPLRGENRGIAATSWALYQKSPGSLTLTEATALAVLIRSPNADQTVWVRRACQQRPTNCEQFKNVIPELVRKSSAGSKYQSALHLAQRLNKTFQAGEVKTTIHGDLQTYIQELIQSHVSSLKKQNVNEAAAIVIENETGEVWAYVGGSGLSPEHKYVDGIQALRQAGSTLKPFLYATAFEKGLITPDSWIEDSAVDIVFERGVYKPQNHDRKYYGWVKAKVALASSLNVPAVKVFKLLNDESFWENLKALNFRSLQNPDYYGPALALGVADITLEDLAQAYRALARNGLYSDLKFTSSAEKNVSSRVFTESTTSQVTEILSHSENRVLGFGLDSSLSANGAAVKTGTSKDMRDNWCVGYNPRFTVAVWVGNFTGEPMWNVMGVTGAAPIWQKIMQHLDERFPSTEKNLSFQQKPSETNPQTYPRAKILYPQDGMILALDPGIPNENQKVPLVIESVGKEKLFWKINGKKISANSRQLWEPQKGRHVFELIKDNQTLESVTVLVK